MKIASLIGRYLLGIIFLIFGLNGFLHFIPMGPMPTGLAGQYMGVMAASGYMVAVFAVQLICGVLFLVNRFVPLALVLIAPVIFNILLFHSLMQPQGLPPGLLATACWLLVAASHRAAFEGILQSKSA
jgi:hypothetical protein